MKKPMNKPKKILIFGGSQLGEMMERLRNAIVLYGYYVEILASPNHKTHGDLLVLLHTEGFNTLSSGAFFPHFPVVPPFKGADSWMDQFMSFTVGYYVNKGIPIVGIGHSALALWATVLGGKLDYKDEEIFPFIDNSKADFNSEAYWNFDAGHVVGLQQMWDSEDFMDFIYRRFFKEGDEGGNLLPVNVPVFPTPPVLHAEKRMPLPE